ncbi:kinesin-like protein KIF27 isoform X2 [Apostichopus japonicus]|uniref:kinesin-like protein KIF27 isoform X2 n=1 Tax=Stichopus japonicus TaxID=307972 RepID=UPI003AB69064
MQEVPVRVAVRVRPLLPNEKLHHHEPCVKVLSKANQIVVGKDRTFTFDQVLSGKVAQDNVYKTCVDALVCSFFEGYNATVFAYGQTGSGKTFTIGGHNLTSLAEENYGILPRAISHVFQKMQEHPSREFSLRASYIEIYKEELRDLLDWETSSKDLTIREDEKGNTVVIGATEVLCQNVDEVLNCLEVGSAHRHTGATNMNEHSSRSHSIFSMALEQRWSVRKDEDDSQEEEDDDEDDSLDEDSGMQVLSAKFHFVDLAGSERAHKTGNAGERFKESVYINSGLLSLGNVISALGDPKRKATHIPYRDSKITRMLKDSLGGNAKTCMITCISPSSVNFDETLNSLKYSNRARNIRNKPTVNHDRQSSRIAAMQTEIQALRDELQRHQLGTAATHRSDLSEPVSELQAKLKRFASQCARYRVCSDEAVKIFSSLQQTSAVSGKQLASLQNWIDIKTEIDEATEDLEKFVEVDQSVEAKISHLQSKLRKALSDLASDEEIFAEKQRQNTKLKDQIEDAERRYTTASEKFAAAESCIKQQEQRLVEQQTKLAEMQQLISRMHTEKSIQDGLPVPSNQSITSLVPPIAAPRPYSVAADGVRTHRDRPHSRRLHSSPPIFSIDRIVQGFKARNQLIVQELQDSDEVLQPEMWDEDDPSDDETRDRELSRTYNRNSSKNAKNAALKKTNILKISRKNSKEAMEGTLTMDNPAHHPNTPRIGSNDLMDLRSSMELNREFIQQSKSKVSDSRNEIQGLALNIRLKEGLIRELVKTGKESEAMNRKYSEKISLLEQDVQMARLNVSEAQRALHQLESKEQQGAQDKKKLASDYRKKISIAKSRVKELERKQQEMTKVVKIQTMSEKRVSDLEAEVGRMKQHMEISQARLKTETERKSKVERELQKDHQKIKELEIRNEQQQKIIKRKTEEVALAKRKLRRGSAGATTGKELSHAEEQKRWLDSEVEKVLERKQQMDDLEMELARRETVLAKKEALVREKGELEIKKLRSSQHLNKDLSSVNSRLAVVEKQLDDKKSILRASRDQEMSKVKGEMEALHGERERLIKQRTILDDKLQQGNLLSPREERRLIGLDEGIEALEAAIEFKNDLIASRQRDLRTNALTQSEVNLMGRLHSLSNEDSRGLLAKYFEKVISLKEQERKKELDLNEKQIKLEEQERVISELSNALQKSKGEAERRLMERQMENEKKMQAILKQAREMGEDEVKTGSDDKRHLEQKFQQLEKDLYYYKKTSRELKKKLREIVSNAASNSSIADENGRDGGVDVSRDSLLSDKGDVRQTPRGDEATPRQFTPIRKSRKQMRELSSEEVEVRRSGASQNAGSLVDSTTSKGSNPWS